MYLMYVESLQPYKVLCIPFQNRFKKVVFQPYLTYPRFYVDCVILMGFGIKCIDHPKQYLAVDHNIL